MTLERTPGIISTPLLQTLLCAGKDLDRFRVSSILVLDFTSILCVRARQRVTDRVSSQNPRKAKRHQPYNFSVT